MNDRNRASETASADPGETSWPDEIFDTLVATGIRQVAYVPDAGHARLINRCDEAAEIRAVALTTEEEGVAMLAGAWLGGQRGALLMQSSGVGNCINMLGLVNECRMPLMMLVTMRGEYGETNPWQVPMGGATPGVLEAMGVQVLRPDSHANIAAAVRAGCGLAFDSYRAVAVLVSQRLIGAKAFN